MSLIDLIKLAVLTPPVEWNDVAQRWINKRPGKGHLPPVSRRDPLAASIDELDRIIERLTRFRAYLNERHGYGCGDQGHASAVKAQNKQAAQVRKALGFTYYKQDISF